MRVAALALAATVAVLLVGCADEIPAARSEPPPSSTAAADSTVRPAEPLPPQPPAGAESEPSPPEPAVQIAVPNRVPSVRLYAFAGSHWPIIGTRHPSESLAVVARAPLAAGGRERGWLLAELPDGTRGWVTADALQLPTEDLEQLPRLERADAVALATTRGNAAIYRTPGGAAHCTLGSGIQVEIAGRSPDGQWFYAHPHEDFCDDANGREIWRGWIAADHLRYAPVINAAPIIHSSEFWLVPVARPQSPLRTGIDLYGAWTPDSWNFDPDDQSIVFVSRNESGQLALKRFTTEVIEIALLPGDAAQLLAAPAGGRFLVMTKNYDTGAWGRTPGYSLLIVESDGRTTEIGDAFLYRQSAPGPMLSAQARWSPDGRAVLFRDYAIPESAEPGHNAAEFWLYRIDDGERVVLHADQVQQVPWHNPAQFHPDGQSRYVRIGGVVRRLTLDGRDWPGFRPRPAEHGFLISPDGQRLITMTNGVGLVFTDQGELLAAYAGGRFQWLPDSLSVVFLTEGRWVRARIGSEQESKLPIPNLPTWKGLELSPDGEHVAVTDIPDDWPFAWWADTRTTSIYSIDGDLRARVRYIGCSQVRWSPDGSQLAVFAAVSLCSGP